MLRCYRTTPAETDGHIHVLFVRKDGSGATSLDEGHFHAVVPPPEEVLRVMVPEDDVPMSVLIPSADHTHDIDPRIPERKIVPLGATVGDDGVGGDVDPDELTEEEVLARMGTLFTHACMIEEESLDDSMRDENAYRGDTWPDEAKNDPDVDMIVVNELESKVDLLNGYLAQNKTDFKFYPPEAGDLKISEVLDVITKIDVVDAYNYHREEAAVFEDAIVTGRGWFNCYTDFSRHDRGNLVIEQFPWRAVRCGPHLHSDLRDLEFLFKLKWMSLARLKVLYPDIDLGLIETNMRGAEQGKLKTIDFEITDPYSLDFASNTTSATPSNPYPFSSNAIEPRRRMVLVFEMWEKEYVEEVRVLDRESGESLDLTGWSKSLRDRFATIPELRVMRTDGVRMRVSVAAGGKLLENGFPDLAYNGFHLVPVYAKKRGYRFWSKIRAAYDLQIVINKRFVQAVDEVNRAASGWLIDDQCFTSDQQRENFENAVSRSNFVAEVKDLAHKPERVAAGTNIAMLEGLIELASNKIREVLGIIPEMMGINSRAESGIAIFQKQRQGLMGNVFLFESLSSSKQILGRIIIRYIQRLYDGERALRALQNAKARKNLLKGTAGDLAVVPANSLMPAVPPTQDAQTDIYGLTAEDLDEFFRTYDAALYDIIPGEAKENPTTRLTWFQIWNDYAATHPDLPPEFLLALSDTPEKDRLFAILEEARAKQQQALIASRSASTAAGGRAALPAPAQPGQQPNKPSDALPPAAPTSNPGIIDANTAAAAMPPETGILTPQ